MLNTFAMTTFTQLHNSILYQTEPQSGDIGWFGYILNPASGVQSPPAEETLDTLFSSSFPYGIFIFCTTEPAVTNTTSANNFANEVVSYLASKYGSGGTFTNYTFVWLQDPASINDGTVKAITLSSYTTFFGVVSPLSYNPSSNIELAIQTNSPCALTGDLFHFFNTTPGSPTLFINTQIDEKVYSNPVQDIYIPANGPLTGCLVYSLQVPSSNYNFPANLAELTYFYLGTGTAPGEYTYPMFDAGQTQTAGDYFISLDPNNQLNSNGLLRTFMVPMIMSVSPTPTLLASGFSTDSGLQVGLKSVLNLQPYPGTTLILMPTANTGLFVYVNNQGKGIIGIDYDLTPQGQYSTSLWKEAPPAAGTVLNLLGGLSGIETFSFQPATESYTGDVLYFWPGNAAYASAYIPPSEGANKTGAAILDSSYTTSWISLANGTGMNSGNTYHSQPTGASLYASGYGVSKESPALLGFFEPVACTLEYDATPIPIPMVPYRLIDLSSTGQETDYSDFEQKVLSTKRKTVLEPTIQTMAIKKQDATRLKKSSNAFVDNSDTLVYSTSPQGLLVQVDTDSNQWTQLVLSSNSNINKEGDPAITMEFRNLTPTLQSAFQTNQQFLVMSWNKPTSSGGSDYVLYGTDKMPGDFLNEMMIEGWPFTAKVPTSDPNGVFKNVFIFKFCDGALMDRINDSSTWTSPELFNSTSNSNLAQLQSWLLNYCTNAISKSKAGDTNYYYFSSIVQDPNWNGILLLQCDISVQDFPPELQGLLAGIDLSRFCGHHFGINVNHIAVDANGSLAMSPVSSLFALIDYTDPLFDQYNDNINEYLANVSDPLGDYNYKVLSLKVLFGNSYILNFNSYVQLAINSLFGCMVTNIQNNTNLIIFTGTYEDQNGEPNYIFNEIGNNLLPLSSNVLNGIEIVKASFVTEQPQNNLDASMVAVKFSFWGFMNFMNQDFDLYSFGSPLDNKGKNQFISSNGLSYSNMAINMSFALDTSSVQIFTFDVTQMAFDLGQSNWRNASLYGHFPLQLTGILTGDSSSQPSSQGYIPLPIPEMTGGSSWAGTWYGLVFNLNMGTMGDLTNSLGFNSTLLMLWTTGASGQMGAMIQLPGLSSQSKSLSLQSVLNLNIGNLQLQAAQNQEGGAEIAYMMSLNQITLKFLSFSFPPSGAVNFYLFGDPDAHTQPSSLGWYLGYQASP